MFHRIFRSMSLAAIALALAGCSLARVSTAGSGSPIPIKTIAMMPGGGLMADAVAVELANKGFTIIDAASTSSMISRVNAKELEISNPESLSRIRAQGVDAILNVRGAVSTDGEPQSASARMTSTHNNMLIAGVTWQNARAGQEGSIADRTVKKGLSDAAAQIANELAARMKSGS
jgi:hypothetical protein